MTNPTEESNPYLALRAAKIARNEARLRQLGLLKKTTTTGTTTKAPTEALTASASLSQSKKKAATSKRKAPTPPIDRSNLRRSKRHAVVASPHETPSSTEHSRAGKEPKNQKKTQAVAGGEPVEITPLPSSPPTADLAPNSARAMNLDVEKLIAGPDGVLGRVMEQTGKAFVMEQAARLAAENSFSGSISFNKYAGVQEWSNALFLWINLGAPNCDVVNEFPQEGRQVTWFGGSRMHEGTRAIQRLMHEGQQTEQSDDYSEGNDKTKSSSCIVLWCRRYRAEKKTFTPYTCLGRLTYHSHEPGSRPLAFCWNLFDYDMLVQHPDVQVRQNFRSVVGLPAE